MPIEKWTGHIGKGPREYYTHVFEPLHIEILSPHIERRNPVSKLNDAGSLIINVDYSVSSGEYGDEHMVYERKFQNESVVSFYQDLHRDFQERFKTKGITMGHHDGENSYTRDESNPYL